jgi:hypothetical protein
VPDDVRASDAEREQTIGRLREAVTSSRLTLDEFSERVGNALEATTRRDLDVLTSDLPDSATGPMPVRRRTRLTASVLAHVVRRGRLRLGRRTTVLSVLADVDLDLRDSVVDTGATIVSVLALLGNVDVYVPEGVDVQVSGFSLLGHRREWGRDITTRSVPCVRVQVIGLAGTIDVWRVPPGLPADHSAVIKQIREQSRQMELGDGPSG